MKNNFVVLKQSLIVFIFFLCLSDYSSDTKSHDYFSFARNIVNNSLVFT